MQDTKLWISGLPSEQDMPAALAEWQAQGLAAWLPAQAALAAVADDRRAMLLWVYRAPWSARQPQGDWLAMQRAVLRLRPRLKARLHLLNAEALDLPALARELGLAVDEEKATAVDTSKEADAADITPLLAKAYEWAAPEYWDVFESLEAAAWGLDRTPQARESLVAPGAPALAALEALVAAGATAPAQRALADAQAEHDAALEQAQTQAQTAIAAAEAKSLEAQEEGELLLLQLHQVQEELEQLFLQSRDHETTATALRADLHTLSTERELAQQQRDAAQQQRDGALKERDASHKERESTLKERDAALKQRDAALTDREATQRALAETQAAATASAAQLQEAQEEGELLLLQLHQVQEELETYFLRGKDLEQELMALRARFGRVQRRYPQMIDVDAVQVVAADAAAAVPAVEWRISGLVAAGRDWPELSLRTVLQDGRSGLELVGPPSAGRSGGAVVPRLLTARDEAQLARFRAVGTRPWRLMLQSAAALQQTLAPGSSALAGAPQGFDPVFWRQALATLAADLKGLPPMFRFDAVRLKREKVNPDYEHLWLAFEGASYGERDLPGFELRLGAAQTLPGGFSQLPKLEIPLNAEGKPPFEGWFEESSDDYGPKLELRANLERKGFDLGVWGKLPQPSQQLLLSVIAALPAALTAVEAGGHRLSRPWKPWRGLLEGLIAVMKLRLAAPRPAPATKVAAVAAAPLVKAQPMNAPLASAPASTGTAAPAKTTSKPAAPAPAKAAGKPAVPAPTKAAAKPSAPATRPAPKKAPAEAATPPPTTKVAARPVAPVKKTAAKAPSKVVPKPKAKTTTRKA